MVVKVLKPIKSRKIKREVKILETVRQGPYIVNLLDTVKDEASNLTSLVLICTIIKGFRIRRGTRS